MVKIGQMYWRKIPKGISVHDLTHYFPENLQFMIGVVRCHSGDIRFNQVNLDSNQIMVKYSQSCKIMLYTTNNNISAQTSMNYGLIERGSPLHFLLESENKCLLSKMKRKKALTFCKS